MFQAGGSLMMTLSSFGMTARRMARRTLAGGQGPK